LLEPASLNFAASEGTLLSEACCLYGQPVGKQVGSHIKPIVMGVPEAISAVPGIDMSDLSNRKHEISQQLLQAAEGIGFFYVTGLCMSQFCA